MSLLIGYSGDESHERLARLASSIEDLTVSGVVKTDTTWLIDSTLSPRQVVRRLRGQLEYDDELMVVDLDSERSACFGFGRRCSNWLQRHPTSTTH